MKLLHNFYRAFDLLDFPESPPPPPVVKTNHSATVFAGNADAWVKYLDASPEARYDSPIRAVIQLDQDARRLVLIPENQASRALTSRVAKAFETLQRRLAERPFAQRVMERLLFDNASNHGVVLRLRVSSTLPSVASREVPPPNAAGWSEVNIVLNASLVETAMRHIDESGGDFGALGHLGALWHVVRRMIAQIAYPNFPRDRFFERISITSKLAAVSANALFDGTAEGQLVPNEAGRIHQRQFAAWSGIPESQLHQRQPYFRMLSQLGSMLFKESSYENNLDVIDVMTREFLDDRYLRLSVGGVMPNLTEVMTPMPFRREGDFIATPRPQVGQYGILDQADLHAWRQVERPFRDVGYTLLKQLGMGEFGRVYEAINLANPGMPERVALKVDRIVEGQKKQIEGVESAMQIGRDLAQSPHVIRVYDAGKLPRGQLTFHVLQVVDGDTLDNLAALTGKEHSSIRRHNQELSELDLRREYDESIKGSRNEGWRRRGVARPFTDALSLAQEMDLQTSILLWLEKIHRLGYVVNDLKNGNLMVNRRGQLKGIDLDAYRPVNLPTDTLTDFLFLATSTLLFLVHLSGRRNQDSLSTERMLRSRDVLIRGISDCWTFGDVAKISHGRVATSDVVELLADFLIRCRNRRYTDHPDDFTADIDRWIKLKRDIFVEAMVLD